jgi:endonuclease/exonuclease/phosphatase family metal-dependent hydrolase
MRRLIKGLFKLVFGLAALLIVAAACLLAYLTATEYNPAETEDIVCRDNGAGSAAPGQTLKILTFNTGYAALDKTEDFFMDGGESVMPESEDAVKNNMDGILGILKDNPADVYFLQEVDADSKRSFNLNQRDFYPEALGLGSAFALNFKCAYVPYPMPTIGKVESGIMTMTDLALSGAERVSLPVPFKWPVSVANLKRCLLVSRVALEGGRELVLVNLHLEAYDSGEGKARQTELMMNFLISEYEKGNYVIAGGDFNQTFPTVPDEKYPLAENSEWKPGELESDMLPEGWSFALDDSVPTCRLLNKPYSGDYADTQLFVIDGFIVSPNVSVAEVKTLDQGFEYSDHNPVELTAVLEKG